MTPTPAILSARPFRWRATRAIGRSSASGARSRRTSTTRGCPRPSATRCGTTRRSSRRRWCFATKSSACSLTPRRASATSPGRNVSCSSSSRRSRRWRWATLGLFIGQEDQNRHLAALLEASRAVSSTVVLDEVLSVLARKAAEALSIVRCRVYEFDAASGDLSERTGYFAPYDRGELPAAPDVDDPSSSVRQALATGEVRLERLALPAPARRRLSRRKVPVQYVTRFAVPIVFGGTPLGAMAFLEPRGEREFSRDGDRARPGARRASRRGHPERPSVRRPHSARRHRRPDGPSQPSPFLRSSRQRGGARAALRLAALAAHARHR